MFNTWKLNLKQFSTLLSTRELISWSLAVLLPLLLLVLFPGLTRPLEQSALDAVINLDMWLLNRHPNRDMVFLGIDAKTLSGSSHKWPWPASRWAEILELLDRRYSPSCMLIDVYLQEDHQNPQQIAILADEMKRNQKTALVGIFEESYTSLGIEVKNFPPIKALRQASCCWGISQQPIDSDGTVRAFVLSDYRTDKKHISWELNRYLAPETFNFGQLPQDRIVSAIFRLKTRANSAPIYSLEDAVKGETDPELLRNKLLIIGPNAHILHDYHKTPAGVLTGPELIISSLETIRSGSFRMIRENFVVRFFMALLGFCFAMACFVDRFSRYYWRPVFVAAIFFPLLLLALSLSLSFHPTIAMSFLVFLYFAGINLLIFRFIEITRVRDSMHEAEICGNIQKKFFPEASLTSSDGISIEGFCLPYQFAGGDYYDYFVLLDNKIFFILADVSGHGISAGMITTAAKSIVSLHSARENFSIEDLFDDINLAIRRMSDRRIMMSAVAGIFFPEEGRVRLCSAGHLPAHLCLPGQVEEITIPGLPLGSSKKPPKYGFAEFQLSSPAQLVLYSDGLIEAVNWQNEMFGFSRFKQILQGIEGFSCRRTIEVLVQDLRKHTEGRGFQDDLTILVINFAKSS